MGKEVPAMKSGKGELTVKIRKVKEGYYLVYYHSEAMQATFSLYLKDTIMGAIALNNFCEALAVLAAGFFSLYDPCPVIHGRISGLFSCLKAPFILSCFYGQCKRTAKSNYQSLP